MYVQQIAVPYASLNTGSGIVNSITDVEIPDRDALGTDFYAPSTLVVSNFSGATIGYNVFTTNEYAKWVLNSGLISDWVEIDNGYEDTLSSMRGGELTTLVVKGLGTHNYQLDITVIKER